MTLIECGCNNFPASLGNVSFGADTPPTPLGRLHVVAAPNGVGIHLLGGDKDVTWPPAEDFNLGTWDGTTFAQRLLIDTAGNVAIGGISPTAKLQVEGNLKAGGASSNYINVGGPGGLYAFDSGATSVARNSYFDGSAFKYATNNYASLLQLGGDRLQWYQAASGVAGTNVAWGGPKLEVDYTGKLSIAGVLSQGGVGDNYFAGRVGIGTGGPAEALEVVGNAKVSGHIQVGTNLFVPANISVGLNVIVTGTVAIAAPTSEIRLDVGGPMRVRQRFGDPAAIRLYQSTPAADRALVGMADDDHVGLFGNAGGGWGLLMDVTNGNVGVGTPTPGSALAIGGGSARVIQMERHTTPDTAGNPLTIKAGGATAGATNKAGGDLYLASGIATGDGSSNIYLQTVAAGLSGSTDRNLATVVTVLGNGKVGIGATPTERLDVAGNLKLTGNVAADGSLSGASLSTTGNLGVRTAPSEVPLHVKGECIRLRNDDATRTVELRTGPGLAIDLKCSGADLYVNAGASPQNTIVNPDGGRVAIGTNQTDPSAVLHVAGDARIDGNSAYLQNLAGTRKIQLRTDGMGLDLQGTGADLFINAGVSHNTSINADGGKVAIGTNQVDGDALLRVAGAAKLDGALARIHGRDRVGIASNQFDDLIFNFNGAVYFKKGTQGGGSQGEGTTVLKIDTDGSLWFGNPLRKIFDAQGRPFYG